jgi:hypothetical protein
MTILEELQKIEAKNGILKPEDVVEYAANKRTALHSHFTWDDSIAAQKYRIWQARQIISVQVEYLERAEETHQVFVSLTTDRQDGGGYRPMVTVLNNTEMREQLLADALAEARLFKQKYQDLKELAAVFAAIEEVSKARPRKRELAKV